MMNEGLLEKEGTLPAGRDPGKTRGGYVPVRSTAASLRRTVLPGSLPAGSSVHVSVHVMFFDSLF